MPYNSNYYPKRPAQNRIFLETGFNPQDAVFEGEDEETYEPEVEVDLLFRLERAYNGYCETIQSWRYLKEIDVEDDNESLSLELELEISEPFAVTYVDKNCSGCGEYRMIVEGRDFEGEFEYLRVVKPTLTAIAQGLAQD